MTRPKTIGSILDSALARLGLDRSLDDYRIWQAWDEVVGEAIARNAEPSRLDGKRLVVVVRNSTWMQELSLLQRDLVERLNAWMGREVISEIFLVVGKLESGASPGRARESTPRESAAGQGRPPLRAVPSERLDAPGLSGEIADAFERLWRSARRRRS